MEVRELFRRDINQRVANDGVAKVWDESSLYEEITEYVVTESIENHLKSFLSSFVESLEARKKAGEGRDGMAVWISGFFGSGKSHFAKIIGNLLANRVLDTEGGRTAIDLFAPHLDGSRVENDIKGYFHQVRNQTCTYPIFLEIKSKENLSNPNSIAEICLSSFYQSLGYSPTVYMARIEKLLDEHGVYDQFKNYYQQEFKDSWEVGREKQAFARSRTAKALCAVLPHEYADVTAAEKAILDARDYESITAESFAAELLDYLAKQRSKHPQQSPHIVLILDEAQQFIGDDGGKIHELQAIVEQLGARGKGQVWVIATGQEKLDAVIERTSIQLALLGKLTGRVACHLHLDSQDVQKVVRDRLLSKLESQQDSIRSVYSHNEGFLADLCRLDADRPIPSVDAGSFAAFYPFLPYQPVLAQEIFDTMRGIRLSGGERSMLTVTQGILKTIAVEPVGALVSFDRVFDEIESELCSDDYLGSHGVRAVREADKKIEDWEVSPSRCLKVLWLIQRLNWIPLTPGTISKMLVTEVGIDLADYRQKVDATLQKLRAAGYVSYDEAKKEYRFLSTEEGEVEKDVLDRKTGYGNIVRLAKELTKNRVLTRQKLSEYRVACGKGLFDVSVTVDGEQVVTAGDVTVEFYGPLSTEKRDDLAKPNLAEGEKGKIVRWVATPDSGKTLEDSIRRYEALGWITTDPKHTSGRSPRYLQTIEEKRIELQELEGRLISAIEQSFKSGEVLFSGEEKQLDGRRELRAVVQDVFKTVIPNLYDRFAAADKDYDPKDIERVLQPTNTKLYSLSPALSLFDSTNQLQMHNPLVETILDEIKHREDQGGDVDGRSIEDFFEHVPFGWPNELVRLVLAACMRSGAIAIVTGGRKVYDYTEPVVVQCLTQLNKFRQAQFVAITTGLSPDQIKKAKEELIKLGETGVQESANDLARGVKRVATRFTASSEKAETHVSAGLPIADCYKQVEPLCKPLLDEDDPTLVVTQFLGKVDQWHTLNDYFKALSSFTTDGKDRRYFESQRFLGICRNNSPLDRSDQASAVATASQEMATIIGAKEIVPKWSIYQKNYDDLVAAYRSVYQHIYSGVITRISALEDEITSFPEWKKLTADESEAILRPVFGAGGPLGLKPNPVLTTPENILDATSVYSLVALEAIEITIPTYKQSILDAMTAVLNKPADGGDGGGGGPKIKVWKPSSSFRNKHISSNAEVDEAVESVRKELTDLVAEGYTVVVE